MRELENRIVLKGQFRLELSDFVEHVFHQTRILKETFRNARLNILRYRVDFRVADSDRRPIQLHA